MSVRWTQVCVIKYAPTVLVAIHVAVSKDTSWILTTSALVRHSVYNLFVVYIWRSCLWTDVNECLTTNDCQQQCTNTEGGYNCSCSQGFTLNSDNKTCDGMLNYCKILASVYCTLIQLLKNVLLIMAVLMVVLLLTTLNNASVLQDMLSILLNALVCKPAPASCIIFNMLVCSVRYQWVLYV